MSWLMCGGYASGHDVQRVLRCDEKHKRGQEVRRESQTDCGFVEEGLVAECGRVEEATDFVGRNAQVLASAEDDHAVLGLGGVIVEVGEGVVVEQDDGARGGGVVLSVGKGDADRG